MLTEADLIALVRHADDDQADAAQGVEPAVEQPQLWSARRDLHEAQGDPKVGKAAVVPGRHHPDVTLTVWRSGRAVSVRTVGSASATQTSP
jgi:hypothetical protein